MASNATFKDIRRIYVIGLKIDAGAEDPRSNQSVAKLSVPENLLATPQRTHANAK
jgi:hypothetical protein